MPARSYLATVTGCQLNGAGAVGHVVWVTGVSGSYIIVSEMNFTYGLGNTDTRTLVPASSVRYILAP